MWIVRVSGHAPWPYCIDVFKDILDVCVVVHVDDILIYSDNPDEHLIHVREALRRLRASNLYNKVEQCAFSVVTPDCLGFVIGPDGLRMDTSKIQVIHDWPTPRKGKDLQSFLGFANIYRRFIASYSDITVPLTRPTRRGHRESGLRNVSLSTRQTGISSAHNHFDTPLPPVVGTDASDYAITGSLSVRAEDSRVHPLAFFSRTLSGAELNYDTHDKELLAIFEPFKTRRHYLESSPHGRCDHGPQESGVLLFDRDASASSRELVGILLRL